MEYETGGNAFAVRNGAQWILKPVCSAPALAAGANAVAVRAGAEWALSPIRLPAGNENALTVRDAKGAPVLWPVVCPGEPCSALCTPGSGNCDSGSSVNVTISDFIHEEGYHFEYLNGSYAVPNVHVSGDWCIWELYTDVQAGYVSDCDEYDYDRIRIYVECGYHYDANFPGGFATKSWFVLAQLATWRWQKYWRDDYEYWECWLENDSMTEIILLPGWSGPGGLYHYAEICLSYQGGHPVGTIDAATTEYYTSGTVVLS